MEDTGVLRWGGLAGLAGVLLSILSIAIAAGFVPTQPGGLDVSIRSFPDARVAFTLGEPVLLAAYALFVLLFLGLNRALRRANPAPALFGTALGVLGLVLLLAGGIPAVAFGHLSDVYHGTASSGDRATLVLVSHGVQAIFNETDTSGGILLTAGFVLLGQAMRRDPAFGHRLAWTSIALGIAAIVGISVISIGRDNPNDYAFVILVVVLPLVLGWKLYRLS